MESDIATKENFYVHYSIPIQKIIKQINKKWNWILKIIKSIKVALKINKILKNHN